MERASPRYVTAAGKVMPIGKTVYYRDLSGADTEGSRGGEHRHECVVVSTGGLFTPSRETPDDASMPGMIASISGVTLDDLWCVRPTKRPDELLLVFPVIKDKDAVLIHCISSERVVATRCADRYAVSNRAGDRCIVSDPLWRALSMEPPVAKRARFDATGLQAIAGHVDCCGFAGRTVTSALSPDLAFVTLVSDYMRDKSPDQILANLCPGCVKAFAALGSTLRVAPL